MKREIKFRTYDIEFKEYNNYHFDRTSLRDFIKWCGRFILEQYTGLKDKSGTDIYEGDIVRILYTDWASKSEDDPRTLEQYLIGISKIGLVEFNDNAWEIKTYSKKYDEYYNGSISYGTHGRIEVIGNIHENPELLIQHKN